MHLPGPQAIVVILTESSAPEFDWAISRSVYGIKEAPNAISNYVYLELLMTHDALKPLQPLPIEKWDPILADIAIDMKGAPLNVHKLMAHNPHLLQAWWSFRNYSVNGGSLGNRLAELVILRVGVQLRAWYEWGSHVDRSLRCGLSLEELNRVLDPATHAGWVEQEAVLLAAVDNLIENHKISEALRLQLAKHFTTAQILDVIAIHGMYVTLGCMIRTWGLELDPAVSTRISEHVSQSDFEWKANAFQKAKKCEDNDG